MTGPQIPAGPGNGAVPQPGTEEIARDFTGFRSDSAPARLAFYGRTNQRGHWAWTELARQLGLCRSAIAGREAVITGTYYDLPQHLAEPPGVPGIDPGGLPHAGGWDALAAAMEAPARGRGFDAVICSTADRIYGRAPVLLARGEFARRNGTPILCADQLALPAGQYRSLIRRLIRWPFTPSAALTQAQTAPIKTERPRRPRKQAAGPSGREPGPCPCECNDVGFCEGCGHAGCGAANDQGSPLLSPAARLTAETEARTDG